MASLTDRPELVGRRDRARGALLGLACGDAVGTTLEFQRPGTFEPIADMVGGGPFDLAPGQWTDDTSMALCLAESMVDTGAMDLADQLRRYLLWRDQGYLSSTGLCFDIGSTTTSQLNRFARTGHPVDPDPNPDAAANGSLMRLAPIPIASHHNLEEAAARSGESSTTTHAAARPTDSCRLFGTMTAALIAGQPATEVFDPDFWQWGNLHQDVAAIAAGSYRDRKPPAICGTGYCIDALEAALWAVTGAHDFRAAVLRAANLGDDADTTAAIAGQLAGARWGASAIPAPWRDQLAMADRLASLADALLRLDPHSAVPPWQFDHLVHAWWAEPGLILAGEYPGRSTGDRSKLDVLLDAGIRAFVDLTGPDDHLRPYADDLHDLARLRHLDVAHHQCSIPDLGVIDPSGYREIVALIRHQVAAAARVRPLLGRRGTHRNRHWLLAR